MRRINLAGQQFGHLTAIRPGDSVRQKNGSLHSTWICQCACGEESTVETQKLRSGHTQSCGCIVGERVRPGDTSGFITILSHIESNRWHCQCVCGKTYTITTGNFRRNLSCGCKTVSPNRTHGMTGTREYMAWHNAKVRCHWPKHHSYPNYGGRGIKVCDEWRNSFDRFYADMGPCPHDYQIERIDPDGNYEPGNCKWVPPSVQALNKRNTLSAIGPDGEPKTIKEIAKERGLGYYTLRMAFKRGEDPFTYVPRGY